MRKHLLHVTSVSRMGIVASGALRPVTSWGSVVSAAALSLMLAGCDGIPSVLDPRGPQAARIASEWWLFFWVCTVVFLAVASVLLYAVARAPRGQPTDPPEREGMGTAFVVGGAVLTVMILFVFLVYSASTGRAITNPPDDAALTIEVIGHQWWWEVRYVDADPSRRAVTSGDSGARAFHGSGGRPFQSILCPGHHRAVGSHVLPTPVSVATISRPAALCSNSGPGALWLHGVCMLPGLMIHPLGITPEAGQAGWPLTPLSFWWAWNREPMLLLGLAGLGLLYAYGMRQLWQCAGYGRGIAPWRVAAFGVGWLTLFIAFISPLDALSAALLSAHMVQHELLMLITAPLLVLGQPLVGLLRGLPATWRHGIGRWWARSTMVRSVWRMISAPLVAWLLHAVVLWSWHAPILYQAALESQLIHFGQHGCFLGSALLFWWSILHGRHGRMGYGMAVVLIFTTAVHSSVLGALLTFTGSPWYSAYLETTAAWGLSPLEDQQLAGLIMWVPAGVIYVVASLLLFAAWLTESERRVHQYEGRILANGPR